MRFNKHWEIEGQHAYLSASKYHWIRYDLEKMKKNWENQFASQRGTRIHKIAADLIRERIRLADLPLTLNMYVNDCIGYRMTPEQPLVYSDLVFGTPDAIDFTNNILRVFDLKTGTHPGHPDQIKVYFAYFCMEYKINPYDIEMILRIYQNDTYYEEIGDPTEIKAIMDKAFLFNKELQAMREVLL